MELGLVGLEHMPLDVSLNICSRVEFLDRMNLLKVSKQLNEIVRHVVSVGDRNSLDGIIIGLPQAGSTSVFWQLVTQQKIQLNNRLDQSNNITKTPDIDITKQGLHYLRRISLGGEGRTATLFHGSSKSPANRRMFPFYGMTHSVVVVIPAQIGADVAALKKSLKQLLMPVFALCGHMNWIFAINKMDLVEYSETVFNEIVTIITQVCQLLSQKIVDKVSFIPISAIHAHNLFQTDNDLMPWYKGPSVLQKLTEISYTVQIPLSKFDINNSSVAILRYKSMEDTRNIAQLTMRKIQHFLVYGYVTKGAVSVGSVLYLQPTCYKVRSGRKYELNVERIPLKVLSIKYFDKDLNEALAGTFVGIMLEFEYDKYIRHFDPYNRWPYIFLRFLSHVMTPIYHSLSTTEKEKSVTSISADIIVVASQCGNWDGKLKLGTTAGFYSYIAHVQGKITEITSSTDSTGHNRVEKPASIIKGQRASIELTFSVPCKVRMYNNNNATGEGRLVLVMHNRVVAMGVITRIASVCTMDEGIDLEPNVFETLSL